MKKLLIVLFLVFTSGCQPAPVEPAPVEPAVEEQAPPPIEEKPLEFWEGWEYGPVVLN